jgi:hypothetical protein
MSSGEKKKQSPKAPQGHSTWAEYRAKRRLLNGETKRSTAYAIKTSETNIKEKVEQIKNELVKEVREQAKQTSTNNLNALNHFFGTGPSGTTREEKKERLIKNRATVRQLQTQNTELIEDIKTPKQKEAEKRKLDEKEAAKQHKREEKKRKLDELKRIMAEKDDDEDETSDDTEGDAEEPSDDEDETSDDEDETSDDTEGEATEPEKADEPVVMPEAQEAVEATVPVEKAEEAVEATVPVVATEAQEAVEATVPVEKAEEPEKKLIIKLTNAMKFDVCMEGGSGIVKTVKGKHYCDACKGAMYPCKFMKCKNT